MGYSYHRPKRLFGILAVRAHFWLFSGFSRYFGEVFKAILVACYQGLFVPVSDFFSGRIFSVYASPSKQCYVIRRCLLMFLRSTEVVYFCANY